MGWGNPVARSYGCSLSSLWPMSYSPGLNTELGSQRTWYSGLAGAHSLAYMSSGVRSGMGWGWGAPWLPCLQRIAVPKVSL